MDNRKTCRIESRKENDGRRIMLKEEFNDKEEVNLWIDDSSYDDYGEAYLMVSWKDWETEEDFEKRMFEKKWAKERAVNSLKQLIIRNPQEAVEIIKELKLI